MKEDNDIDFESFYDEKKILKDTVQKKYFYIFRHAYVELMNRITIDKIPFNIFFNAFIYAYINEDETLQPFIDKVKEQFSKMGEVSKIRQIKAKNKGHHYRSLYGLDGKDIEDIVDNGDFHV